MAAEIKTFLEGFDYQDLRSAAAKGMAGDVFMLKHGGRRAFSARQQRQTADRRSKWIPSAVWRLAGFLSCRSARPVD